jgi:flagellar basal body-associated protein FliL
MSFRSRNGGIVTSNRKVSSRKVSGAAAAAGLAALWLLLAAAAPARASSEAAPPAGPVFVKLAPIVLPVFSGESVVRQAGLVLALELEKNRTEADIEAQRPRLMNAFIGDLVELYEQRQGADRVIDPAAIKERLQGTAERVLGRGIVHEVLIQQAFERARPQQAR